MNIQCEKCGAHFTVTQPVESKERTFKLRCHACREVVSVHYDPAARTSAPATGSHGPGAGWSLPVNGAAKGANGANGSTNGASNGGHGASFGAEMVGYGEEGSGLIDMRAMAAQTLAAHRATAREPSGSLAIAGLASTIHQVSFAPLQLQTPRRMPVWMWGLVASSLAIIVGTGVLGIVLWRHLAQSQRAVVAPVAIAATVPSAPQPAPQPALSTGEPGAPAAADEKEEAAAPARADASRHRRVHGAREGEPRRAASTRGVATAAAHRGGKDQDDELERLLESTRSVARRTPPPQPVRAVVPAGPTLPERPDKSDVIAGLRSAQSSASACFDKYHVGGAATVKVVIGGDGQVRSADVAAPLSHTPSGDCVARAVRGLRFKKFRDAFYSVTFAYLLK